MSWLFPTNNSEQRRSGLTGGSMDEPEILFEQRGKLGLVTLNRPKQLNALSYGMVKALHPQLEAWANDPSSAAVAIRGAGEKAFCAGGDIRALYEFRGE